MILLAIDIVWKRLFKVTVARGKARIWRLGYQGAITTVYDGIKSIIGIDGICIGCEKFVFEMHL